MPTDTEVIEAMKEHHARLAEGLSARASAVAEAARDSGHTAGPRSELVAYIRSEILPHAAAEEQAIYPRAARLPGQDGFIRSMVEEHRSIREMCQKLADSEGSDAADVADAIAGLFETHAGKENDIILPALAADPNTSLADLLDEMHAALG